MDLLNDPEYVLHQMHKRERDAVRRRRFSRARSDDPRKELAGYVEQMARVRLARMGYRVARQGYNDSWDLVCEGLRLEVKGATFSSRRYQAAIRNHQADLLLFGCQRPEDRPLTFFVIPAEAYRHVHHISIWSEDPRTYAGKWMVYLEAWPWVDVLLSRPEGKLAWQPALMPSDGRRNFV